MRGLNAGDHQLVAPPAVGATTVPSAEGNMPGTRMGRPFESRPSAQVCRANGLPRRNSPVARSRV